MRDLAQTYPELAAFTPDATLLEIKTRYGLNSLQDVLAAGQRKQGEQAVAPESSDRNGDPKPARPSTAAEQPDTMAYDVDFTLRSTDHGTRWQIVLAGELDLRRAPRLARAVAHACATGTEQLELDLRAVTFIDSTGVCEILQAVRRCREHRCSLTIVPSPHRSPRRLFKVLQLEDALPWQAQAAGATV